MSFFRPSPVPSALRTSPLAEDLPSAELRQLGQLSTVIDVPQGKTIIAESTAGRECFIVLDGEFDVTATSSELHAKIRPGEVAGELALLTGRARTASVVASRDATVCALHSREFSTLFSQAHRFRSRVLTLAYERLNAADTVSMPADLHPSASPAAPVRPWSAQLGELPAWGRH